MVNPDDIKDDQRLDHYQSNEPEMDDEELNLWAHIEPDVLIKTYIRDQVSKNTFDPHKCAMKLLHWRARKEFAKKIVIARQANEKVALT